MSRMVRSNAIVVIIVLVVVVVVVVVTAEEGTVGQLVASVVPAVTVAVSSSVSFFSAGNSTGVQRVAPWLSRHGSCRWSGRLGR